MQFFLTFGNVLIYFDEKINENCVYLCVRVICAHANTSKLVGNSYIFSLWHNYARNAIAAIRNATGNAQDLIQIIKNVFLNIVLRPIVIKCEPLEIILMFICNMFLSELNVELVIIVHYTVACSKRSW